MKKEKFVKFEAESDVNSIECSLANAYITIEQSDGEKLSAEFPSSKNISVACGEYGLIISQTRRTVFARSPQHITVYVPPHIVPAITVHGKTCGLSIEKGIYGQLSFYADDGAVTLSDCAFESVDIAGGSVKAYVSGTTVKGNFLINTEKGNVLAENTFSLRTECRVKKGNLGLVNVNCKDCAFDTDDGNISVTLAGKKDEYNLSLIAKEGTVNRENAKPDGADGSVKAYAGQGNIVLDFEEDTEKA